VWKSGITWNETINDYFSSETVVGAHCKFYWT
jgi:hypothetical protein